MAERLVVRSLNDASNSEFVLSYLRRMGFEENVIVRESKDCDLVDRAMESGTDRDDSSEIWMPNHRERLADRGLGPGDVIYAEPLTSFLRLGFCAMNNGMMYLFYDGTKIEQATDKHWQIISHDIYRPRADFSFTDALIAAMVIDIPRLAKHTKKRENRLAAFKPW